MKRGRKEGRRATFDTIRIEINTSYQAWFNKRLIRYCSLAPWKKSLLSPRRNLIRYLRVHVSFLPSFYFVSFSFLFQIIVTRVGFFNLFEDCRDEIIIESDASFHELLSAFSFQLINDIQSEVGRNGWQAKREKKEV